MKIPPPVEVLASSNKDSEESGLHFNKQKRPRGMNKSNGSVLVGTIVALVLGAAVVATALKTSGKHTGAASKPTSHSAAACRCDYNQAPQPGDFSLLTLSACDQWTLSFLAASGIQPGGEWFSTSGNVDQGGNYATPKFALPDGIDTLTYVDPSGVDHTFMVYVASSAQSETPTAVPSNYFEEANAPQPISAALQQQFLQDAIAIPVPSTPDDGQWHEVSDGTPQPPPSPEPSGCLQAQLVSATQARQAANGRAAIVATATYTIPSGNTSDATLLALTVTGVSANLAPKTCAKHHPLYPAPKYAGTPCTGGSLEVDGPVKKYHKVDKWITGGTVTVTASMSATIEKVFGISVSAGVVISTQIQPWEWKKIVNKDIYNCVNGVWTYCCSKTCTSTGTGCVTIPSWYDYIEDYNPDGSPTTWSPYVCNPL